jgi:hypothetical protein
MDQYLRYEQEIRSDCLKCLDRCRTDLIYYVQYQSVDETVPEFLFKCYNSDVKITGRRWFGAAKYSRYEESSTRPLNHIGLRDADKHTDRQTNRRGSRIKAEEDCP